MATYLDLVNGKRELLSPISVSTGAGDANKIIQTGPDGKIDSSFLPGQEERIFEASEAIDVGAVVNIFDDLGTPKIRNASGASGSALAVHGIALEAAAVAGDLIRITSEGYVVIPGAAFTAGDRVYLANVPGDVTTTPLSATGELHQYLGVAASATELQIEFADCILRNTA